MDVKRWNFSLRDLMAVMIALGICFALLAHWVNVTREQNRQTQCVNNLRQIGIAMHNHHDVQRRFPNVTYPQTARLFGVSPGSLGTVNSPPAGYGWGVRITPFLEEATIYNVIHNASGKFQSPAFSASRTLLVGKRPVWSVDLACFRCPSYSGSSVATAPEYVPHSGIDTSGKPFGVAVSNYVATTATHLGCVAGDHVFPASQVPDGLIVPPPKKMTIRDAIDGLYATFMLCESRESAYSSWYDGTVGWVVAADPNGPQPTKDANNFWVTTGGTSLQLGPWQRTPNAVYLPAKLLTTIKSNRQWGPSSEHPSGMVNHLMGDASAVSINPDIDPTLYLQLTTRAGREPATLP